MWSEGSCWWGFHEDVDVVDIWCWSARMISLLISWRWSRGKTRDCLY
jgi:hypothetical protein